jgi:hypothetical protein
VSNKRFSGSYHVSYILVRDSIPLVVGLAKLRLYIRGRKQGFYIASVPMKELVKLSGYDKRKWSFEDGWLILEGF